MIVDTSVWVDFFRPATPETLRRKILRIVDDIDVCICEPSLFELQRAAPRRQRRRLNLYFDTVRVLPAPSDIWTGATRLGQKCLDKGHAVGTMDLLIAETCMAHDLPIVTFDRDFQSIAAVSALDLILLDRQN